MSETLKISEPFNSYQNGKAAQSCVVSTGRAPLNDEKLDGIAKTLEQPVASLRALVEPNGGSVDVSELPNVGHIVTVFYGIGQGKSPNNAISNAKYNILANTGSGSVTAFLKDGLPEAEVQPYDLGQSPKTIVHNMLNPRVRGVAA